MQVHLSQQAHVRFLHCAMPTNTFRHTATLGRPSYCTACKPFTKFWGLTTNMARTCVMPSLGNVCEDICVHLGVWLTEINTCAVEGSSLIRIGARTPESNRVQLATDVQHAISTMWELLYESKSWQGSI